MQPTPDGGIHPRMFQDRQGNVHLLYFRKRSSSPRAREGDLFYREYDAALGDWGTAFKVSSQSFNYADPIYRANLAIDDQGRIHVIWYQSRPDQVYGVAATLDPHHVLSAERESLLPIERQPDLFRLFLKTHLDLRIERENEGPVGQSVGTDRGHDDDPEIRVEDWSAGRQIVGGRAGRGGDDQSVGPESADQGVVHVHRQIEHSRQRGLVDHRIVDDAVSGGIAARRLDGHQEAFPTHLVGATFEHCVQHRYKRLSAGCSVRKPRVPMLMPRMGVPSIAPRVTERRVPSPPSTTTRSTMTRKLRPDPRSSLVCPQSRGRLVARLRPRDQDAPTRRAAVSRARRPRCWLS